MIMLNIIIIEKWCNFVLAMVINVPGETASTIFSQALQQSNQNKEKSGVMA
jgi:hypothetical protein